MGKLFKYDKIKAGKSAVMKAFEKVTSEKKYKAKYGLIKGAGKLLFLCNIDDEMDDGGR